MSDAPFKLEIQPAASGERLRSRHLVDAIVAAIEKGQAAPGDRLPAQRDLAAELGIAVGTVTRAYMEVQRRGLIDSRVGRGTIVAGVPEPPPVPSGDLRTLDFNINRPPSEGCSRYLGETLASLSRWSNLGDLISHQPASGRIQYRSAGADWIGRTGYRVSADQVVLASGVQHGIAVVLAAMAKPGDVILTEEINYPGIKLLARVFNLGLVGISMDEEGMEPDALAATAQAEPRARFVFCTPTVQNPTTSTMSLERRQAIAAIIRQRDLLLIEDDIYGLLPETPLLPIASLAPERSFLVAGTSKALGAGVRVGFVAAPESAVSDLTSAAQATVWMTSPLMAEVVTLWLRNGTVDAVLDWHRKETAARLALAREILHGQQFRSHQQGYNIWLSLPEPWRETEFWQQIRRLGLLIAPGETFTVGRHVVPHSARISLGNAANRSELEHGLRLIQKTLKSGPQLGEFAV